MVHAVEIGDWQIGERGAFLLIAGPCVIESEEHAMKMADALKAISKQAGVPFLFKSSYYKANRTSVTSYRGPGLREGLRILDRVKRELGVKVLSDVHTEVEAGPAAEVLDVLQTPAFLCRQTDFLLSVARTGRPVNVKKGQFLSPWDMQYVVEKIRSTGNDRILLTERGTSFGYNQLINDMRGLRIMRSFGFPVIFDATHSAQVPGGLGGASGGQREFVLPLARAAAAVGVDGLFIEVHDCPERALSDGPNSLSLDQVAEVVEQVLTIHGKVKEWDPES